MTVVLQRDMDNGLLGSIRLRLSENVSHSLALHRNPAGLPQTAHTGNSSFFPTGFVIFQMDSARSSYPQPLLPPFARGSHYEAKSGLKLVTLPALAGTMQMHTTTLGFHTFWTNWNFLPHLIPDTGGKGRSPLILRLGRIQEQSSKALDLLHARVYFLKKFPHTCGMEQSRAEQSSWRGIAVALL